ncbi:MAG: ATP-binding protein [Kiritimatiellae bacterium]|nr:ATP-binding protein [Kiritimatiellia bacterium]MBQ9344012.1 ATP-binding protein [Kiritimatiellia bacterium]
MKCIADKTWQVPNELEALTTTSGEVEAWLASHGLRPRVPYTARLIVEEMGTNIIKYGYDDRLPHFIHVQVLLGDERVRVLMEDDGHPFNPFEQPPPNLEELFASPREGGLGIELVRRVCVKWNYERVGKWNRVTLDIAQRIPDDDVEEP